MNRCKWLLPHKWERYISKDTPTTVEVSTRYSHSYALSSTSETMKYQTVITRLVRYCERCGDKQIKHADILHIRKVEEKV